jgi:hypothetical protein
MSETLDLAGAALLLCISEDCLLRKARAGKVPGTKIGRRWVFVRADLIELIRKQASERKCSIAAPTLRTGGPVSKSEAERSASQLAREIANKRKSLRPQLALVRGGRRD